MPSTIGFLGAIPALEMSGQRFAPAALVAWGVAVGVLGVLVAAALRDRFIVQKPLPFPDGKSIAVVIQALYARGGDALRRTRTLLASGGVTMALAWVRDGKPAILPSDVALPGSIRGMSCASLTLGFSVSPMLIGMGMLIGPRGGLSMFVGSIAAWVALAPRLAGAGIVSSVEYTAMVSWLLWPGVALMTGGAIGPFLLQPSAPLRALAALRGARVDRGAILGGVAASLAVIALAYQVFGVRPLLALAAVPVSLALTAVSCHTAGETGIAPIANVGQATQLGLGIVGRASVSADVGCGAIASGCAAQSAQSLDVLKAGHMLGASPRRQIVALCAGVVAGGLVSVPAYTLVTRAYGVGNTTLPAPFALTWKVIAELVASGGSAVPPYAGLAAAVAFVIGIALSLLAETRWKAWALSPFAIGVAFMVPAGVPFTMALGAAIVWLLKRRSPEWVENQVPSLCAGAIGGEGLVGVLVAALKVAGILS
jgi:uncharacterized oligopeptide transporter (OPT) family protein